MDTGKRLRQELSIVIATDDTSAPKRSKRSRAAQACERCRLKKYKCDELYPCSQCKKNQLDCLYQGVYRERETNRSASYIRDLEKKVEDLTTKLRTIESEADARHISPRRDSRVEQASLDSSTFHPIIHPTHPSISEPHRPLGNRMLPASNEKDESADAIEEEISEVNQHTNSIEFHGKSSSIAFLGHLQKAREPKEHWEHSHAPTVDAPSLISTLHNPGSLPQVLSIRSQDGLPQEQRFYFEQAHVFIDGYFDNLHFVHPLIDKEDFIARAHDLWFGRDSPPDLSFIALYLSLLSLGALVRVWDEVHLAGLTRFEWSRKLFGEAQMCLNKLQFSNNLETVQCLYLMAKISQNELNPNLAYMYLGLAIRTCLSSGFNRETIKPRNHSSAWISKTWWGIFSLEIETSFSIGRPDTLGMDEYHNRSLPERDDSEFAIIPWMVDFAQIIRRVSVQIYHSKLTLQEKMKFALHIERQLDLWLAGLPEKIRPDISGERASLGGLRDSKWSRRQRLVLGIRYHYVKMLLFRPFLIYSPRSQRHMSRPLEEVVIKCLDSARKTIQVIHEIFRVHSFFRCWWYNTTYIMFAASILLLPVSKFGVSPETKPLLESVNMTVEILEAMDESVVAKKSVEILRYHLREFRDLNTDSTAAADQTAAVLEDSGIGHTEFSTSELSYGIGFFDYSFEGMAGLFGDLGGFPFGNN